MPDEGEAAAAALRATGLVLPDAERLRLLAPVRAFAAEQRAPDPDLAALTARFAALADALPWAMEMPADPATAARARAELANIEAVLGEQDAAGDVMALARRASQWIGVGDARLTLGSIALALHAYLQAKAVNMMLMSRDPNNPRWQRDLSVSWEKLGGVRGPQGDLQGALDAYTASKEIFAKLAAADPGNAGWQRDLVVSHWKLAALLERMPERADEASAHWSQALAIARTLADTGRLAPPDAYFVETLQQRLAAAQAGAATAP